MDMYKGQPVMHMLGRYIKTRKRGKFKFKTERGQIEVKILQKVGMWIHDFEFIIGKNNSSESFPTGLIAVNTTNPRSLS